MSEFGGPVNPNVALGGFDGDVYRSAKSIIITFIVNNHEDEAKNKKAEAWEKAFISFMKDFKENGPKDFQVSFSSERSIQDELDRESESDVVTILISYIIMFLYISIALGQFKSFARILVSFFHHPHPQDCFFLWQLLLSFWHFLTKMQCSTRVYQPIYI